MNLSWLNNCVRPNHWRPSTGDLFLKWREPGSSVQFRWANLCKRISPWAHKFDGWSSLLGLQCHVRWEDLSNLELTREILTHWLQMKSGRYLSLWAIHLIILIVFFLYSYSYGSPLSESLPSWTSTRARSPGRGFWTPTTGRFDLYIVRKHKSDKLYNNSVSLQIPEKDNCGTEPDREGSDQVSLISKCIISWISFLSLTWLLCVVTGRLSLTSLWPGEIVFEILT